MMQIIITRHADYQTKWATLFLLCKACYFFAGKLTHKVACNQLAKWLSWSLMKNLEVTEMENKTVISWYKLLE